MSSRRSLAVIVLVVLAACRTASRPDGLPPNFGVVEEGKIYRGAQPDAANLEALQRRGIRTIVKLNGSDAAEEATAARLGMQIVSVPLDARTVGNAQSCDDVERAYQALTTPSNWPVYVHCTHGRDRTGYLVGLYRERAEQWAYPRVEQELGQYGHGSLWRLLLPNISHTLAAGAPVCAHSQ